MSHPMDKDALYHCECGEWHYKWGCHRPPCEDQVTITLTKCKYDKLKDLFRLLVEAGTTMSTLKKVASLTRIRAPTYEEIVALYKEVVSTVKDKI